MRPVVMERKPGVVKLEAGVVEAAWECGWLARPSWLARGTDPFHGHLQAHIFRPPNQ